MIDLYEVKSTVIWMFFFFFIHYDDRPKVNCSPYSTHNDDVLPFSLEP